MPIITMTGAPAPTPAAPSGSQRAVELLMKSAPSAQIQESPVGDQSRIQPGELSAISELPAPTIPTEEKHTYTSEATTSSEGEVPKSKDPLSSQYAILARQEKALRAARQKLNAEREAFKADQAKLQAPKSETPSLDNYVSKDRLKDNLFEVMSEMGMSYDQLTQQALNQPSYEEQRIKQLERSLDAKVKKLEEEQLNTRKSYEEGQKQAYNQALSQLRSETNSLVRSSEEFETIRATNSESDVVQLIEDTFNKDGQMLTVEEAARAVEDYLFEEALKLSRLKKVTSKLRTPATPVAKAPATADKAPAQLKTLTNSSASIKNLSAKERAILAFRGELK